MSVNWKSQNNAENFKKKRCPGQGFSSNGFGHSEMGQIQDSVEPNQKIVKLSSFGFTSRAV